MALAFLKSKKEFSVKHMIHQRLAGWEPARDHKRVHASELMKELEFCPREYALLDLLDGKKKDQYVGTAQRITFDHGKDVEKRVRNDWLRDSAVGIWRCPHCGSTTKFGKAPKVKCPKCGGSPHLFEYEEYRLVSATSGITGGIDMFLDVGDTKHRLVEIKSIDKEMFKELQAPLAEHRFRTSLYLRLLAEHFVNGGPASLVQKAQHIVPDTINVTTAHILYISKGFGLKDATLAQNGIKDSPFSPFKEFIIERDDEATQTSVNKATALRIFRDTQTSIPCGVCTNALTKRAQKCSAVSACFSGKYPATITWVDNGNPKHPGKPIVVG